MSDDEARDEVVGRKVVAVTYHQDFIEILLEDDLILTGTTKPFGTSGCAGINEMTIRWLIGRTVEYFVVEPGRYVAVDSQEIRVAFPIDEESKVNSPEAVRLYKPAHYELDLPAKHWIW